MVENPLKINIDESGNTDTMKVSVVDEGVEVVRFELKKGEKGETGNEGKPGKDSDATEVADALVEKMKPIVLEHVPKIEDILAQIHVIPGKDGSAGKDSEPAEVASFLKSDPMFIDMVRPSPGEKGEKGNDGSPDTPEQIVTKVKGILSYNDLRDLPEIFRNGMGYLANLSDVNIQVQPSDGQALVWNAATKSWRAGTISLPSNLVNSVSNSDGTLTISPTTGNVIASLNLGSENFWTGIQHFSDHINVDNIQGTVDLASYLSYDNGGRLILGDPTSVYSSYSLTIDQSSGFNFNNAPLNIRPEMDWTSNAFQVFSIGSDPNGNYSGSPLSFDWDDVNQWLMFSDGVGDPMVIRANISSDSISSGGFFGGSYFGDASGLTTLPTNQFLNGGQNFLFPKDSKIIYDIIPAPTNTITTGTSTSGGTLAAGTYTYWVSYITSDGGETDLSPVGVSQVTTGTTSTVSLSNIPKSTDSRVSARNIWRGFNNTSGIFGARFLVKINNNTATTLTDNGSISVPTNRSIWRATGLGNTTGGQFWNASGTTKNVELDDNGQLHFLTSRSGIAISKVQDGGDTANRFTLYNTTDEVNNVEWGSIYWDSDVFRIGTLARNAASVRPVFIFSSDFNGTTFGITLLRGGSPGWFSIVDPGTSQSNLAFVAYNPTGWSASGGTNTVLALGNTLDISMSGAAAYNLILSNISETSVGSGAKRWINMQLSGVEKFTVSNTIEMVQNLRADAAIGHIVRLNSGTSSGDFIQLQDSSNNILFKVDVAGNAKINKVGSGLYIKEGSNATMGTATLVAGTVVVSTTKVTANSRIFLTAQSLGTVTIGQGLAVSARTAGTSFTVLSQSALDTSVVAWMIIEPA